MAGQERLRDSLVGIIALMVVALVCFVIAHSVLQPARVLRAFAPWFGVGFTAGADQAAPLRARPAASSGAAVDVPATFRQAADSDAAFVSGTFAGHWVAVLSWFQPQDKTPARRTQAFDTHLYLREFVGARLLAGRRAPDAPPAWVTVSPIPFDTADQAQSWCRSFRGASCRVALLDRDGAGFRKVVEP